MEHWNDNIFKAVAKRLHLEEGQSYDAAHSVLVDGKHPAAAATDAGISRQYVSRLVTRMRDEFETLAEELRHPVKFQEAVKVHQSQIALDRGVMMDRIRSHLGPDTMVVTPELGREYSGSIVFVSNEHAVQRIGAERGVMKVALHEVSALDKVPHVGLLMNIRYPGQPGLAKVTEEGQSHSQGKGR